MEERVDDQNDQPNGQQQLVLNAFDRGSDGRRPVGQDIDLQIRREGFFELRKHRFDAIYHVDNVRTGLSLDVQQNARRGVSPSGLSHIFDIIDDVGHLG